jgi:hypothetical protein
MTLKHFKHLQYPDAASLARPEPSLRLYDQGFLHSGGSSHITNKGQKLSLFSNNIFSLVAQFPTGSWGNTLKSLRTMV